MPTKVLTLRFSV